MSKSTYPSNWPELSRLTKEESGWRCVRCKHPDDPEVCKTKGIHRGQLPCDDQCRHEADGKQRVLTVHHLDGNKANCRWWNLAALCQKCHLEIQGRVTLDQGFLFPDMHSDWFKPHLIGYNRHRFGHDDSRERVLSDIAATNESGPEEMTTP